VNWRLGLLRLWAGAAAIWALVFGGGCVGESWLRQAHLSDERLMVCASIAAGPPLVILAVLVLGLVIVWIVRGSMIRLFAAGALDGGVGGQRGSESGFYGGH
jgi:hypothetical protein